MLGTWDQIALSAFVAAFVTGLFLLGGYYYNRRLERVREEEQVWQRVGMPVIKAADELIARLFDNIVRGRSLKFNSSLNIDPKETYNPSKELSTVWRLMRFFAASVYLEQHIADERAHSKISTLRHYANNKSRIPLKGNLYRAPFPLQTEGQQWIGSKVLNLADTREIRDVDFFHFVNALRSDPELLECAEASRKLLNFSADLDHLDPQFLCVAQFVIYLIDLVQDLRPSSKWEEFRLFLVVLLKAHNTSSASRASFLYKRGDLKEGSYLDTYSIIPMYDSRWYSRSEEGGKGRRNRRLVERAKAGFPRELGRSGVKRRLGSQEVLLGFSDSPGDIRRHLNSLFS